MNNRISSSLLTLSLLSAAIGAQAQVAAQQMEVAGTLRTPVCTVTATENGIYDYGRVSSSVLPVSGHYALPKKTQTWTVNCGAGRTYVSMWPTDNREGTASGGYVERTFGLGRMDGRGSSQIGYYLVTVNNARVDGVASDVGSYSTGRNQVFVMDYSVLRPRDGGGFTERAITWARVDAKSWSGLDSIVAGSMFEMDLEVEPFLASNTVVGGGSPVTDRVDIDGSATLTFKFGL